ncbi:hypothetical protein NE865_01937 [Phthorimaea operculella]|nr:hypothetical protein NE865_01937 [Phthorimaea operculella]
MYRKMLVVHSTYSTDTTVYCRTWARVLHSQRTLLPILWFHPLLIGYERKTIRFWIRRAEETGGDLSAHHRQLYQRATTREQDAAIVEAHKERPFLNTATTASQYSVSQDTIRRRLKEGGLKNRKPAKKIVFTQAHAEARVGFCLQYYNFDWENNVVIFVDEKTFRSDKHGRSVLWRPDGTRYEVAHVLPNKTSGHVSLGFWGWISSAGPGELVEIDGRMNATEYVELLRDVMVPTVRLHHPEGTIYLVQDNSSVHNAGTRNAYINSSGCERSEHESSGHPESVSACEVDDVAVYNVKLHMMWDDDIFHKEFPGKAQWSQVFGQSHNRSYALYRVGEVSRPSVLDFIQFGTLDPLMEESEEEPKVYDQFIAPAVENGEGETETVVFVDGEHSMVSLMSKILPSEDWFIGVDSLDLCLRSSWVDQLTLDLEPMEAGIEGQDNKNPKPVKKIPHSHFGRNSLHKYNQNSRQNHIAKVEFTKVKEYSSKELNNLVRKEILHKPRNYHNKVPERFQTSYEYNEELTTQNNLQRLKDLEEEPVGTPRPNNPDNNVVVVTKAPAFEDSQKGMDSSELDNMDEVVLAVANGKKLGLGKHLPRHFRSRLHHAVNKIHGNDCVVSAWSDWSPCTDPCSKKKRVRTVVQRKRGNGKACPPLIQEQVCGRCVRGDGDYTW